MQLNIKDARIEEVASIVARLQGYFTPERKPLCGTRISAISIAENGKERGGLPPPHFNVDVEIDERLLPIEQVIRTKKTIEECLLANQNWT